VLEHDTQIAAIVRVAGWIGMIAVTAWLGWRGLRRSQSVDSRIF